MAREKRDYSEGEDAKKKVEWSHEGRKGRFPRQWNEGRVGMLVERVERFVAKVTTSLFQK